MKGFMKGFSKVERAQMLRRLVLGLGVAVLGFVLMIMPDTSSLEMLPRMFAVSICSAMIFGGIGYILGAAWLAIYGFSSTLSLGIPKVLEQPWSGLCVLALLGCMVFLPRLFAGRDKDDDEDITDNGLAEIYPFPVIFAERGDSLCQIVRGDECILSISLGDKLIPKPECAISSLDDFKPGKGCIRIGFRDIEAVHISIEESGAYIRLKTPTKSYRWFTPVMKPEEIESVFEGLPVTYGSKMHKLSKKEVRRKEELKKVCNVLQKFTWIAALLILFVGRPYKLLAVINMAIPIIFLVIYTQNLDDWELFGNKGRSDVTFGSWYFCALALLIRSLLDFNFRKPSQLLPPMCIAACAGIALFFLLSAGHRKRVKQVLCFLLCIVLYVPGSIVMVNHLLPVREAESHIAVVEKKTVHTGGKGPTTYRVTVSNSELGTFDVHTASKIYDQLETGDEVVYLREISVLGIETGNVRPASMTEG